VSDRETELQQGGPVIRDKRRIDPETFEVRRAPAAPDASGAASADGAPAADGQSVASEELAKAQIALAERTADLQRLQAEYVNYKRRVDRDRDVSRAAGVEGVLRDLLSVLDDVGSARLHEELSPGFKAVADELSRVAGKYGLESFGEKGDPFDPHIHEALLHAHADGITGPTCVEILQPGYRIKDKVIRPARVAVAEPSEASAASPTEVDASAGPDQASADPTDVDGADAPETTDQPGRTDESSEQAS